MERKSYWLFKSDADEFSVEDLASSPGQTVCWDGVRNYQARNYLRDSIREGDLVLFYHSRLDPAVVGTARVTRAGYPDHSAWDPGSRYHDPGSTPEKPVWFMVDIRLEERFQEPLPLSLLRTVPELNDMVLLKKGNRLSVQPVTPEEFAAILSLAKRASKEQQKSEARDSKGPCKIHCRRSSVGV